MRIGVDVGGTNTDAVLMDSRAVKAVYKAPTSENVNDGIVAAIKNVLNVGQIAPKRRAGRHGRHHPFYQCLC